MSVVEALQVHLVEIDVGTQEFQNLWSPVAVRDEAGHQADGASLLEDRDRPLAGDQRLVVGADDDLGALREGIFNQCLRCGGQRG